MLSRKLITGKGHLKKSEMKKHVYYKKRFNTRKLLWCGGALEEQQNTTEWDRKGDC